MNNLKKFLVAIIAIVSVITVNAQKTTCLSCEWFICDDTKNASDIDVYEGTFMFEDNRRTFAIVLKPHDETFGFDEGSLGELHIWSDDKESEAIVLESYIKNSKYLMILGTYSDKIDKKKILNLYYTGKLNMLFVDEYHQIGIGITHIPNN